MLVSELGRISVEKWLGVYLGESTLEALVPAQACNKLIIKLEKRLLPLQSSEGTLLLCSRQAAAWVEAL